MHRFFQMSATVLLAAVSLPAVAFGADQVPDVKGDWVGKTHTIIAGRGGHWPTSSGSFDKPGLYEKDIDITKGNYDFTIVYPTFASQANIDARTKYVKRAGLVSVAVTKDEIPPRTYPFFANPDLDGKGLLHFFDYPTTLRSSYESIGLVLKPGALGERKEDQDQMEKREVRNFVKALKHLMSKPEAGGFAIQFHEIKATDG